MIATSSPYFSSGIVERAKRERAWNHPTRERRDAAAFSRGMICTFFLPFFCTTATWNFQKLLRRYTLFGGNVAACSRSLFFTAAHFHLGLVAASISHFATAATKFSCCSSNKNMSPLFFISLYRPFSRLSFAGLPPTFLFLCLSLALYSKFVDKTIYLSLIL